MFCKHCGMESATPDMCSWCRHSLTAATFVTVDVKKAAPAEHQDESGGQQSSEISHSRRFTLAGELVDDVDAETAPTKELLSAELHNHAPTESAGSTSFPHVTARSDSFKPETTVNVVTPAVRSGSKDLTGSIATLADPESAPTTVLSIPVAPSPDELAPPRIIRQTPIPIDSRTIDSRPAPLLPGNGARVPAPPVPRGPLPRTPAPPGGVAPRTIRTAPVVVRTEAVNTVEISADAEPEIGLNAAISTGSAPAGDQLSASRVAPVRVDASQISAETSREAAPESAPSSWTSDRRSPRQQARMEQEAVESVGLAAGVSANSRPSMLSNSEMQLKTALSGSSGMVQSKYYDGHMVDTIAGVQYNGSTGAVASAPTTTSGGNTSAPAIVFHWDEPQEKTVPQLPKYLLSFTGILVICGLLAWAFPTAFAAPICIATFLGGMLLPVFRVIPWQDDDADDAVLLLVLLLVFGPAIGLVIYGFVCLARQDAAVSVIGCLSVALAGRVVIELAAMRGFNTAMFNVPWVTPPSGATPELSTSLVTNIFTSWTSLFAMAGWYVANVFHKADE